MCRRRVGPVVNHASRRREINTIHQERIPFTTSSSKSGSRKHPINEAPCPLPTIPVVFGLILGSNVSLQTRCHRLTQLICCTCSHAQGHAGQRPREAVHPRAL